MWFLRQYFIAFTVAVVFGAPTDAQNSQTEKELETAWVDLKPILRKEKMTPSDLAALQRVSKLTDRAIARYPANARYYIIRGNAMLQFRRDNAQAVLRDANQAIALAPNDAEAYYLRGRAYRLLNRNAEAIKDWRRAAVDLKLSDSAMLLGRYYKDCRDYKQALSG